MNRIIVGIDEAGRGPLAGRVYAACVILDSKNKITGLNDSKKLSEKKRNLLFYQIINNSKAYTINYATPEEIDTINILKASFLAMKRALNNLDHTFDYILIDGNQYPFKNHKGEAIIKGDTKIPEIMAASILAKVARDNYMNEMDKIYPDYQFAKHKGYPTKIHRELIKKFGPCNIHRKSFKCVKEYI